MIQNLELNVRAYEPGIKGFSFLLNIFIFLQLRVRDLEGALEVEKSAVEEAKHNLDTLTKQHRFVTRMYDYALSSVILLSCISYL